MIKITISINQAKIRDMVVADSKRITILCADVISTVILLMSLVCFYISLFPNISLSCYIKNNSQSFTNLANVNNYYIELLLQTQSD